MGKICCTGFDVVESDERRDARHSGSRQHAADKQKRQLVADNGNVLLLWALGRGCTRDKRFIDPLVPLSRGEHRNKPASGCLPL
jgi:hypothetical protein